MTRVMQLHRVWDPILPIAPWSLTIYPVKFHSSLAISVSNFLFAHAGIPLILYEINMKHYKDISNIMCINRYVYNTIIGCIQKYHNIISTMHRNIRDVMATLRLLRVPARCTQYKQHYNNFALFSSTPVVTAHEAKGPCASTRLKLWQKCGPPVSLGNLRIEAEA